MRGWPRHPRIMEINTWVWLDGLGKSQGHEVTLAMVPREAWNSLAELRLDAVWLMGVWERSPHGLRIALEDKGNRDEFARALPDCTPADVAGSPYCVRRYEVDERFGGNSGMAVARKELAKRGLRLILDYVPNHVAPDHPWVTDHPDYLIQGGLDDLGDDPASYRDLEGRIFACGRDPYFPAWQDVLQVNAFHPGLRRASVDTAISIAEKCDGMRCDMAMLLMNDVFARTWGPKAGSQPADEFWPGLIGHVRKSHPDTLFIAEAYWDLEWDLQQQGFDYCYDKRLYDRLLSASADDVRNHVQADLVYQNRLIRFIENHDEERAASAFSPEKEMAAAVAMATLPGGKLFHEGQFEGRRVKLPVFLKRRPQEPVDSRLNEFYKRLLASTDNETMRQGRWRLCELWGWPDNGTCTNLVAWSWSKGSDNCLVVVNLSDRPSQARVHVSGVNLAGEMLHMADLMSGERFERSGSEVAEIGLYVDLGPWAFHVLGFECP